MHGRRGNDRRWPIGWPALLVGCQVALFVTGARAQFGATAEVERPVPAGVEEDPTATATVVRTEGRSRAVETTDELVLEVPGARARRRGGFGAFTALALRGGEIDQTVVLYGHLPLASRGAAFDLSTIPLSFVERIEVYRGGAPLWLGANGIGGVVRLVPKDEPGHHAEGRVGGGSFGLVTSHAGAAAAGEGGLPAWHSAVGLRHADNDYTVTDDAGTPDDPTDDFDRRRRNAEIDEGWAFARAKAKVLGGTLEVLGFGFGRTGGLAGAPVPEPLHARRNLTRALGAVSWERRGERGPQGLDDWRLQLSAGEIYERDRLSDPRAEIEVRPQETDDTTYRTFARLAGSTEANEHLGFAGIIRIDHEGFDPRDRLAPEPIETSNRFVLGVGAEARLRHEIGGVRGEIRPSVRLEIAEAELVDIRVGREDRDVTPSTVAPTARLGFVVEPWRGVALNASVSESTRLPTIEELFGNRGFALGNVGLDEERATSVEGGTVIKGRKGVFSGQIEAHVFGLFVRDLIQLRRTDDMRLEPVNTDRATIVGVEGGLRGDIGRHFSLVGALTWMHTEDGETSRQLPLRPDWQSYVRPELSIGPYGWLSELVVFGDVTYVSDNLAREAGTDRIPDRLLLGAGLATDLLERRVRVSASVRDILDQRPLDLAGFPLPGRSVRAELTLKTP